MSEKGIVKGVDVAKETAKIPMGVSEKTVKSCKNCRHQDHVMEGLRCEDCNEYDLWEEKV